MKYSSCLSKLHSDSMKYRATCLWLCLIWKEVLFLALVEKQATNIKCKFVSLAIFRSMYEALYADVCRLTSGPSIAKPFPVESDLSEQTVGGFFKPGEEMSRTEVVMKRHC